MMRSQEAKGYTGSETLNLFHGVLDVPAELQCHKVGAGSQVLLIKRVLCGGSRGELIFFVERFAPCRQKIFTIDIRGDPCADLLMLLQTFDEFLRVVRGTCERDFSKLCELGRGLLRRRGADAPFVLDDGGT